MNINSVNLITFSPTGTSKKVGKAIAKGSGFHNINDFDLTLKEVEFKQFEAKDLVIVTAPIYGGHIAPTALARMQGLKADGSPTAVVVVYGNRDYEKALAEFAVFLSERGFNIIAGGTFIGEHSYSNEKYPIAIGRPNANDLKFAEEFGRKICKKITDAKNYNDITPVNVLKIERPEQSFISKLKFIFKVIKLKRSKKPMPRIPSVDESLCEHCGYCAAHCPTGAITKGMEEKTDPEKCIRCCACVKGCPKKARTFESPFAEIIHSSFTEQKENKTIL